MLRALSQLFIDSVRRRSRRGESNSTNNAVRDGFWTEKGPKLFWTLKYLLYRLPVDESDLPLSLQ
jgi:hypothetical protein